MIRILAGLAAASIAPCAMAQAPAMPKAAYEAAFSNMSASPSFVLVKVVNAGGKDWTGCVAANHLIGALVIEHDLSRDQGGFNAARDKALAQSDHVFQFSKPAAVRNIPQHTETEWAEARRRLRGSSNEDLLRASHTNLDTPAKKAAVACAIIERGLGARMIDRTGAIVAEQAPAGPLAHRLG